MKKHQWLCTSKYAVQDPSGPSQFDSIFIRVQTHQGYSAFDRNDHVFTLKEASEVMFWMTHQQISNHSTNSGVRGIV